jgi:hypothetical protein
MCWVRQLTCLGLAFGAAVFMAGCGKKPAANGAQQAVETNQPPSLAGTVSSSTTQAIPQQQQAVQANGQPDLPELNRAIRRWLMANHRVPANFDEFAATAGVPIPPPPAGKKYVLRKDMHIELVNQ